VAGWARRAVGYIYMYARAFKHLGMIEHAFMD